MNEEIALAAYILSVTNSKKNPGYGRGEVGRSKAEKKKRKDSAKSRKRNRK